MVASRFRFTLKAWPVIAIATIGLCYLTQLVASWFGVTLSEQNNVDLVRRVFAHGFDTFEGFVGVSVLLAQIVIIMPVLEELIFRGLIFKLPLRLGRRWTPYSETDERSAVERRPYRVGESCWLTVVMAVLGAALFSFAHYPDWLHANQGLALRGLDNAFLALFLFGLAQCWLYWRTDRLWCSMLNHALFNATNLLLLPLV